MAVKCKGARAGGYVKGEGIVVCSNHLQIQDEVTQVVIQDEVTQVQIQSEHFYQKVIFIW
ncbi:hypothetical protein CASFOL_032044 [Castilleja foliolosa]|uniref:Uncharacterized protein n=1 Tax=Castilleja foliolosa TaxID=1961234 RepID=A0ABD3C0B2_9LAMI